MNKIIIENDKIVESDIEYKYTKKENIFDISKIEFNIDKDSKILLNINIKEESKLIITFNILDNINTELTIITQGNKSKIQYNYNLSKNASINIEKLNILDSIRELITANLEENSSINYIFKSISYSKENYDYMIYHNGINSNSNIINNSINEQGSIYYQISSFIPKNITGCSTNQYNRIINKIDNICEIKPNLYIDCDDVEANHSALIDTFNKNELFYLESKGINKLDSLKLLEKGFLLSKINDKEIINIINKKYGGE